jgi:ABC-type transporter MlaC component
MNTLRNFCFIAAVLLSNFVYGQSNEKITQAFFKTFKENPTKAYGELFENSKWMKEKKSDIETIKIKLADFISGLGEYYGYEPITEKSVGESYILKSFLVKYERQPVRFTFILYKPNESWQTQNFSYDTGISEEIEEAAKAYRLKSNW